MRKKVWIAIALSIVPGLAHFYIGKRRHGSFMLIISASVFLLITWSRTYLMKFIAINIYLFTAVPALVECYQTVRYGRARINTDSRWYVSILLLTTGFSALPLLWHSRFFSRPAKIAWTILVPAAAAVYFFLLVKYWGWIEKILVTTLKNL